MRPRQTTFFQNSSTAGGGVGAALLLAAAACATMLSFVLLRPVVVLHALDSGCHGPVAPCNACWFQSGTDRTLAPEEAETFRTAQSLQHYLLDGILYCWLDIIGDVRSLHSIANLSFRGQRDAAFLAGI